MPVVPMVPELGPEVESVEGVPVFEVPEFIPVPAP